MSSDESMSLIACEVEECAFSTPKLGRDAYPAMVAHLQVHSVVKHGIQIGQAINPLHPNVENQDQAAADSPLDDGAQNGKAATRRARTFSQPARMPENKVAGRRGRSLSRSRGLGHPCTDCNEVSFETEKGLFIHRRRSCGLKGVHLNSLDFVCPTCPRAFTTPMGVAVHRRHCKGDEVSNSTGEVRDSSSTVREPNRLRAQVDIFKMSEEASPQVTEGVGVEKARKRQYAKVAAEPDVEGDGSEVVVVRKVSRVSTQRSEASGPRGSSFKSPLAQKKLKTSEGKMGGDRGEKRSDTGEKSKTMLGCGVVKNFASKGILKKSNEGEGRSQTEATTSLGHREAWMVSRSSSASRAPTEEENGVERRNVTMEISMKLPTGQKAYVVYRVRVNTEMKKVVDKVALKLGVPSSRVRLYNAGTPGHLASSVVTSSDVAGSGVSSFVDRGVNNISPSRSCRAVVGTNALANRFQGMKLEAIVVEGEMKR